MTLRRIRARLDSLEQVGELLGRVEGGTVMAILEAIAAGVPCAATNIGGAALFDDDVTMAALRRLGGEDVHA